LNSAREGVKGLVWLMTTLGVHEVPSDEATRMSLLPLSAMKAVHKKFAMPFAPFADASLVAVETASTARL
jgi:hypothetical protein